MPSKQRTAPDILAMKGGGRIAMLTAYDFPTARLADEAGADAILVGDSLGMVCLGLPDTLGVTMDHMLHHTAAVVRGVARALVVADMPFLSYHTGVGEAVANAGRFLQQAGARAVKLEGGAEFVPHIQAMLAAGIPVMGHIGLTPQQVARFGGFKAQGKTARAAKALLADARALAQAGCFALVLEAVPAEVAERITAEIPIPTIGIGAGPRCDGQVLVFHDVLGLCPGLRPSFVKQYTDLWTPAREALAAYCREVREGAFPAEANTRRMAPDELDAFQADDGTGQA
ncbi:3-methyl-2-oxobutanoate hydroxymethyltransferase [Humidesulfovibrio mexicanus]|uniref:3-methyl-2-oxobutanoate hydroxymethyltransferase n=1 Tax=Humidesulfovibrio mexicanus TaxID=147047 RepID=A0A239A8I6_9BACT|nr:3-methyl-2-oxobutanoate hydroxymethyltransferase [Humidesulfovibrio mexicanus]SNR91752.1 3-methyl-2-oxobutanoate hydroxymethyltransferase [Humidesulfovibrio mexicanus]